MTVQEYLAVIGALGGLVATCTASALVIIRALRAKPEPPQ